ncbi:MAG: hypothetical protein KBA46_03175 [Candidatus Omnitrophica bacterium]|nr:hypothetical protein [Candidatus Omnitrophota bacterium]
MLRFIAFVAIALLCCCVAFGFAADTDSNATDNRTASSDPWLQEINVTSAHKIQIPKDMKVERKDSRIILEDHNEYLGRRLYEMQLRLDKVEARQEELSAELAVLRQIISRMPTEGNFSRLNP